MPRLSPTSINVNNFSKDNIIYGLSPVLTIGRILGIKRLQLKSDNYYMIKIMYFILKMVYITCIMMHIYFFEYLRFDKSFETLCLMCSVSLVVFNYFAASLITSKAYFNVYNTTLLLLSKFDKTLNVKSIEFYKYSRLVSFGLLAVWSCAQIAIITVVQIFILKFHFSLFVFAFCLMEFVLDLEALFFCCFLVIIKYRLILVNEYLIQFLKENSSNTSFRVFKIWRNRKIVKIIDVNSLKNVNIYLLATSYEYIGEACYLINIASNLHIFLIFFCQMSEIPELTFHWIQMFMHDSNSPPAVKRILPNTVVHVMQYYTVWLLVYTSQSLVQEHKATCLLVNEIVMLYHLPRETRLRAKAFQRLLEAWPMSIRVFDMFSLNINLILKMSDTIITIAFIVVQTSKILTLSSLNKHED